mmetsp:Transcript_14943/g.34681  ORF Transcript_14943/g.34681 Transcript_14943/m.34681 type:complete len:674 (+) Transcript_14943:273-2294(+)
MEERVDVRPAAGRYHEPHPSSVPKIQGSKCRREGQRQEGQQEGGRRGGGRGARRRPPPPGLDGGQRGLADGRVGAPDEGGAVGAHRRDRPRHEDEAQDARPVRRHEDAAVQGRRGRDGGGGGEGRRGGRPREALQGHPLPAGRGVSHLRPPDGLLVGAGEARPDDRGIPGEGEGTREGDGPSAVDAVLLRRGQQLVRPVPRAAGRGTVPVRAAAALHTHRDVRHTAGIADADGPGREQLSHDPDEAADLLHRALQGAHRREAGQLPVRQDRHADDRRARAGGRARLGEGGMLPRGRRGGGRGQQRRRSRREGVRQPRDPDPRAHDAPPGRGRPRPVRVSLPRPDRRRDDRRPAGERGAQGHEVGGVRWLLEDQPGRPVGGDRAQEAREPLFGVGLVPSHGRRRGIDAPSLQLATAADELRGAGRHQSQALRGRQGLSRDGREAPREEAEGVRRGGDAAVEAGVPRHLAGVPSPLNGEGRRVRPGREVVLRGGLRVRRLRRLHLQGPSRYQDDTDEAEAGRHGSGDGHGRRAPDGDTRREGGGDLRPRRGGRRRRRRSRSAHGGDEQGAPRVLGEEAGREFDSRGEGGRREEAQEGREERHGEAHRHPGAGRRGRTQPALGRLRRRLDRPPLRRLLCAGTRVQARPRRDRRGPRFGVRGRRCDEERPRALQGLR